jgi:Tfp pilus assembly protein PilF
MALSPNIAYTVRAYALAHRDIVKTRVSPLFDVAYNNRGFDYLEMGKLHNAEKDIKKALSLNPEDKTINMSMAEFYAITKKPKDACEYLNKAIEKGWDNWDYLKNYKTFDNIRSSECFIEIIEGK